MKLLLTLSLIACSYSLVIAQSNNKSKSKNKIYRTIADGSWNSDIWSPSIPPMDLSNVTIVIDHKVDYISNGSIFNWNTPTGQIIVSDLGDLTVNTNNNRLVQTKGFVVINHGKLVINTGQSSYKIDKDANLINNGKISLEVGIIDFKDGIYASLFSNRSPSSTTADSK